MYMLKSGSRVAALFGGALLAAALAVPAANAASGGGAPNAGTHGTTSAKATTTALKLTGARTPKPVKAPVTMPSTCGTLKQQLAAHTLRAAVGQKYASCLEPGWVPDGAAHAPRNAVKPADSPVWCDVDGEDEWWVTRSSGCISQVPFEANVYDIETGELIGFADFEFSDSITLDPVSSQFSETNFITMVDEVDAPELLVTYNGLCTSSCAPVNPSAETDEPIVPGDTVSGTTIYNDAPSGIDTTTLSNEIWMFPPGGEPLYPGYVNGSPDVRCDSQLSTTGCVYPEVTPDLNLSITQSGAGAVFVDWAELQLGYGYTSPVHLFSGMPLWSVQDNRDKVCDSTFVKDPTVDQDSCDEYAFASTYESGGLNSAVTSGSQCAEIKPYIDDVTGQWDIDVINGDTSYNCARAHVSLPSNSSVGGVLGNFVKENRVLDDDAYYIGVSQ